LLVAISWMSGWYVRGSTGRVLTLSARAERATRDQRRRLRAALDAERRRVARDLHDVVAHGVSLIGVLAGAAEAQLTRDRARAREALDNLDTAAGEVTDELERLLGALRGLGGDGEPLASLADLPQLVSAARDAGQPIDLRVEGDPAAVPAGVAASAYRIVQEALTNARKHAAGADVQVHLVASPGGVDVEVANGAGRSANGGGAPGEGQGASGHGIEGMSERARLLGGELEARATPGGGFRVSARLPLAAAAERRG
jgi:signal transduction histidine kinase